MTAMQKYFAKMARTANVSTEEQPDELNEFLAPIITELTKQNVKYNQMTQEVTLDLNKMTIVQKNEYEKY